MFLRMLAVAFLTLSPALPISASGVKPVKQLAATGEPGIVGTWRLIRFENRAKDGTLSTPYGEQPKGYFVYDPTGYLSIHIMRNPPLPPFASGASESATDAEKTQAFSAYVGYFGTYRVDRTKRILHHQVEGALDTTYTNTEQLRPYRLAGDKLIIELTDPKTGTHYYRELHRVR